MNRDLLTQLADYGDYCEQRQGAVAIDDIDPIRMRDRWASSVADVDSAADSAQSGVCETCGSDLTVFDLRGPDESEAPPAGHRARTLVVAAVAAAIVLVVGVVVADGNRDNFLADTVGPPEVTDSTTTDESPEVTDPPTTDESPGVTGGRTVFGGPGTQAMNSVTVGGPGLVAVGRDRLNAVVWTSVDGIAWSRVPHDEAAFANATMAGVTQAGPGLVAVGVARGGAGVWTSVDGIAWSRVPHDEAIFGGAIMSGVSTGGPGVVAVGSVGSSGSKSDAAVWTSVDGMTWSRVRQEAVLGGAGGQAMYSVTVGGPGLVAVGRDWESSVPPPGVPVGDQDAAVWTSVDGMTWNRVPHDETIFGGAGRETINSVIAAGPGLVAVGGDRDVAIVWTSADGITWSRVPHDGEIFSGSGMESVTGGGPGLVAVGLVGPYGEPGAPVWTSVDGITWSRIASDEAAFAHGMTAVTSGGPGLVASGLIDSPNSARTEGEWPLDVDGVVWTSVDGINWSRIPDAPLSAEPD